MYVEFDKYDSYELNLDSLEYNEVYFWSELADRLGDASTQMGTGSFS